ncbi:MAG: GNAT family N-acetyltransferase, partial [Bdellovibrionales bacterium]|nr:GNAT family N-acetyltransferase [Bdellovibrionales bacterium]
MIHIRELSLEEAILHFPRSQEEREILSYPFDFRRTHFVADLGGKTVGRISANVSKSDALRGYFGFFHVEPDLSTYERGLSARELLSSAETWLKENRVGHIVGPVNYSTLFDYRIRLDSEEEAISRGSFFWEPVNTKGQVGWLTEAGYRLHEEYHSRAYRDVDHFLPVSEARYQEALSAGFKTRPIRFSGAESPDLEILYRINTLAFQDSFLAEPFDLNAYQTLNVPKYTKLLSEFSFFLLDPKGTEVGYFFLFPDQGYLVWKTLAVLPEYQKSGLAGFGIHHALKLALGQGITKVVAALIRKGAPSESLISRAEPLRIWEHRYG